MTQLAEPHRPQRPETLQLRRGMAPLVRTLLIALLVASLAVQPASGAYQEIERSRGEVSSKTVTILVPAVGELADGTLVGVTMTMAVTVRDGTGGVFVDTRPLTQVDMQGSARLAAATAAAIAGTDMAAYDFFITIRTDTTAVGGPSAGAAMTAAFTALLLDLPLRDDVVMTGMINPDGSVGPVGGILEKAEAAHNAGASLFLIPQGQAIVEQVHREVTGDGWFPTVEERVETLDVREHARSEWGLEVRELTDVYEAIRHATDHEVSPPEVPEVATSDTFVEIMGSSSRGQATDAETDYEEVRQRFDDTTPDEIGTTLHESLTGLLDRARDRLDSAARRNAEGAHYTASSHVFQANLEIREVEIWLDALAADDPRDFVTQYGADLSDRIDAIEAEAAAARPGDVSALEAVGAAQVRVLEAKRLLTAAESAHEDDRTADAIDALAFAEERRRSVAWWLDLAQRIDEAVTDGRLRADVDAMAAEFRGIAQEALAYAEVLLGETGATADQSRLLQEASFNLRDAREADQMGLRVGALYLAMEARVGAHAALSLVGSQDLVDERVGRQRDLAFIAVESTRRAGAEPFLAVSYLDFAETLRSDQPVDALLMFGNAAAIAGTSQALASGRDCGFAGVPCRDAAPAITRVGIPGPDPWTAYFALATVLLGFMAGILVTLVTNSARRRQAEREEALRPVPPAPAPTWRPPTGRRQPARYAVQTTGTGQARPAPINGRGGAPRTAAPVLAMPSGGRRGRRHGATTNPK